MVSFWPHLGPPWAPQEDCPSGPCWLFYDPQGPMATQEAPRGFQDAKNDPPSGQNDAPSGQNDPPSGQNDPPSGHIDLQKRPPEHNTTHNTEHNTTQQHRTQDNTAHLDSTRQGGGATLLGALGSLLGCSWGLLGVLGSLLGSSWVVLGGPGAPDAHFCEGFRGRVRVCARGNQGAA